MSDPVSLPLFEIDQGSAKYGKRVQSLLNRLRTAPRGREDLFRLLTGEGYRRQSPELSRFDDWYVRP